MLYQNFKGLLTLVFIFTLLVGGFYLYKEFVESSFITSKEVEQYPISENIEINPKIEISEESAVISWETPFETIGAILYCPKENTTDCKETGSKSKSKKHSIILQNLDSDTNYSYKILIENKYYPLDEKSYFGFKTLIRSKNNSPVSGEKPTRKTTVSIPTVQVSSTTSKFIKFKEAVKKQDLNFDINKDGKVDMTDYTP